MNFSAPVSSKRQVAVMKNVNQANVQKKGMKLTGTEDLEKL